LDIRGDHRFPIQWQQSSDTYACLTVTDTGHGMATETIGRIFDPFYTDKVTGRGLGLAVALGIVKSVDGCITVESEPGKGSTFRVFLPLFAEAAFQAVDDNTINTNATTERGTVLLVEDEEILLTVAKAMLERLGFDVISAKDGAKAVELFRDKQDEIRLVISDLTMPRMNGWETLAVLRHLQPDVPVILTSGYDKAQVMAGCSNQHPQAFLHKPYQMEALKSAVAKALGDSSASTGIKQVSN